jgi:hypothetical protein
MAWSITIGTVKGTAIDLGDAQRPVLVRQTADLAMLPLKHHENKDVARRVCLHQFQLSLAAFEVAGGLCQGLSPVVAAGRQPAEWVHQCEAASVGRQLEIPAHFPADECRGGFLGSPNQPGKLLVGDATVRLGTILVIAFRISTG